MAQGQFTFVDNFSSDPRARKKIRSHVMRGKNKTRRNGRQASDHRSETPEPAEESKVESRRLVLPEEIKFMREATTPQILKLVGNDVSGVAWPGDLSLESSVLIKQCELTSVLRFRTSNSLLYTQCSSANENEKSSASSVILRILPSSAPTLASRRHGSTFF